MHVIGGLKRLWAESSLLSEQQIAVLNQTGNWEKQWVFCRCQVNGMVYQCEGYKRVTARNNFTVAFVMDNTLVYGSIKTYVKVAEGCRNVQCTERNCHCEYDVNYFAIIEVLEKHPQLCMQVNGRNFVKHMVRVLPTNRHVAVTVNAI